MIEPLPLNWIDEKFDIKWKYLLCFIFVDTAFLLCRADIPKQSWQAFSTTLIRSPLMSTKHPGLLDAFRSEYEGIYFYAVICLSGRNYFILHVLHSCQEHILIYCTE